MLGRKLYRGSLGGKMRSHETGGTGSGSCPVAACSISDVECFMCSSVCVFVIFNFYVLVVWPCNS